MDVDFLSSVPSEAQMELMAMMMQMEKLPEFSETPSTGGSPLPAFYTANVVPAELSFSPPPPLPPLSLSFSPPPSYPDPAADPSSRASVEAMREMIFRIAAMQPIHIDPESVKPPKRRNVRISKDPQSVAARHRRERISERIRILQRLVPGGTKMDTASMLDEAIHYVKFLKTQVQSLERAAVAARGGAGHGSSSSGASPSAGGFGYSCYEPRSHGYVDDSQMMS